VVRYAALSSVKALCAQPLEELVARQNRGLVSDAACFRSELELVE
jgi:hypothetical protein